ncbi:hypothetical protein BHE74_00051695 [Ensete ventricosum]|nr:hypothetical protein BHE74_00051695 [Ensete ventricosum]RZR82784.1 hypothetical protein BHM03_00009269 [Ensete ventricosum]
MCATVEGIREIGWLKDWWTEGLDFWVRGGCRPRHGWLGSVPCPSCLLVQLFFLNMRKDSIFLEVDDSNLYLCGVDSSIEPKIALRA